MKKLAVFLFGAAVALSAPAFAADYVVDKQHTNIGFSVKHLMISNVKGNFTDFEGTFSFDDKTKSLTAAETSIKSASIFTNEPKRDEHLKSPDFFDAAKFPAITFKLKKAVSAGGSKMKVVGDLTIRGVTKEVALDGEFEGSAKDPWGNTRAAFTASGVINRTDFGLKWNKLLDEGGVVVGEEVKLLLELEGIMQKPAAK